MNNLSNIWPSEKVKQFFFISLLILLGWVLFSELKGFLPAFLGALTFYVMMRKWMFRLVERGWKPALATVVLMLLSFLIIMLPIYFMINMLASKILYVIQHSDEITKSLEQFVTNLEKRLGYEILNNANISKVTDLGIKELPTLLGATFNTLTTIIMLYFILYFMLVNGKKMEAWFQFIYAIETKQSSIGADGNTQYGG